MTPRPRVLRLVAVMWAVGLFTSCATSPDVRRQAALKQAEYHYGLGSGFYVEGDVTQSLAELTTALELNSDHADAHHLMAVVRIARREFYEALTHAERAVALEPTLLEARNNLGVVYMALCRWEDAVAVYEKLIREPRYSTPWVAHNNLGWALWKSRQSDEAMRQFRKAVFFNPQFCLAFNNLGIASLEGGRFDDAERQLRSALGADPSCSQSYAEPHLHLARLYERQSDTAQACAELQICVDKAPPGEEQTSSGCGHSPVGKRCERKALQMGCPRPRP